MNTNIKTLSSNRVKNSLIEAIGHTPLVKLDYFSNAWSFDVLAKLELLNPGGSIKDRTAANILQRALERGEITANTTVVESSSGNMGIGLAWICLKLGLKLIMVVDPHLNQLNKNILNSLNAEVVTVENHDGKGGYLLSRLTKVEELLREIPDSYTSNQYKNTDNPGAHVQTVDEILADSVTPPDYIFVPTSTGGTITGIAQALRARHATSKIIAVDAVGSIVFGGKPGERLIPGMGSSRKSDFITPSLIDAVVHVSDEEVVRTCHRIRDAEGLLVGGSSGAVIRAMERMSEQIPRNAKVVGMFCDRGERYIDTIYHSEWVAHNFKI